MLMISLKSVPKNLQHEHAHRLLRSCLGLHGISPERIVLAEGNHGKPYLPQFPELHFNLSHANGICACMTADFECGIDAETLRKYRPNVVRKAFSENERIQLESIESDSERDLLFTRLWTLKEAYVKAIGIGISYPLRKVCFDLSGGEIATDIEGFRFRQYILQNGGSVVSLCIKK